MCGIKINWKVDKFKDDDVKYRSETYNQKCQ